MAEISNIQPRSYQCNNQPRTLVPLRDFFFFYYFFFSFFIMSLNLSKNLPDSRFILGFGGGYVPTNSNDVTNRTSTAAVAASVPRKRLKRRIDSNFFLNSSNNVTNQTFMPAAAASISNKSNTSVPSNFAISGMCYCLSLFYSLYFLKTLLTITFIYFVYLFLFFCPFHFFFFGPCLFHIYSTIW